MMRTENLERNVGDAMMIARKALELRPDKLVPEIPHHADAGQGRSKDARGASAAPL